MILGIGTDISSINRIKDTLTTHGDKFITRCFSIDEKEHVNRAAKGDITIQAAGFAKRWAAKEACAKALGLGIRKGIFLKDISLTNDTNGAPSLILTGGAKERLTHITPKGMNPYIHVSLSDDSGNAIAFIIISAEQVEKK